MKILSPKNKKMAMTIAAIIGALFLFGSIYGSIKSGVKDVGGIAKALWEDIKGLIAFSIVFALTATAINYLFPGIAGLSQAVLLGVLTTGAAVVTTFNTTYVPKIFHYVAATQLTGVKITVQGDGVIFDSDANGLNHCGVSRIAGQVTNNYTFRIADGLITGKNVIWEFTNSAAQTPSVYVDNDERPRAGGAYLQLLRQAVLANSGQNFDDFATLSFPSLAATDQLNILHRDGTQQQLNRADVLARLQYVQNIVNTPVYMLDNYVGNIKTVNIIAGSAQTAYIQRWVPASGRGMVNQQVNY